MQFRTSVCILFVLLLSQLMMAQIGGRYAFESVSLPVNARLTALGGHQLNVIDSDVALALQNPAVSNSEMHNMLNVNHNFHFAGISHGSVIYGRQFDSLGIQTHIAFGYIDYGQFQAADPTGDISGEFSAGEVALIAGAGKQINERLRVGANIKFLSSRFESYGAIGLGMDLGLHYSRPGSLSSWSFVLRNIGTELNAVVDDKRSLPFELQVGFSKRLAHLPFRFTVTGQQLQQWYIRYDDPDRDISTDFTGETTEISSFSRNVDNLFRHLIFSGEFLIGSAEQFRLRLAYNHLRRQEMRLSNFRSLAGFSFGIGFNVKKIKFDYGIGYYHLTGATNHLSLRLDLERIFNKI